jgi:hypothetical protein
MARTTPRQFARRLRQLGATITIRNDHEFIARHRGVAVAVHFDRDHHTFETAWCCDPPSSSPIRSMTGVRRALGLPAQPILTLGTTGRRNSRTHIVAQGWLVHAEWGVSLLGAHAEGGLREVT